MGLSVLVILLTFGLLMTKGLNYGIDFTGGAEIEVKVPADWQIGKVREELTTVGLKDFKVIQIGADADSRFLVKVQADAGDLNQLTQTMTSHFEKGQVEILRTDVVGPAAGKSLRMSGFLSLFYALICILIYVTIRFDARYSPGAVLALFHDAMITLGVLIIAQVQFDLTVLAAILALIGYSNNDTIIVYDRVRETLQQNPKMSIIDAVNLSANETLGRTLLTAFSTFLSAFALWAFGGPMIQGFAFTFMVGIIVGTYSSIFIASSAMVYLSEWQIKRRSRSHLKPKKVYAVRPDPSSGLPKA
jgi:preprotein translocase subunit SecF